MNAIFDLSPLLLFLCVAAFGLICLSVALVLLRWFSARFRTTATSLPVAPFFTAVTTVWALSLGFAAGDLWNVRGHAEQAASAERSSVSRLFGMSQPDALDAPKMRRHLLEYRDAVVKVEWGENDNRAGSDEVETALQNLRLSVIELARRGTPDALMGKMAQDFDELQDARNVRLAIGSSTISSLKWYLVLVLTVLSAVAIAAVHADKPAAGRTALAIYVSAAIASIFILGLHANPYSGGARVGIPLAALRLN